MTKERNIKEIVRDIRTFSDYKGGDKSDQEMNQYAVDDMVSIAKKCDEKHIPQPEYFPYYDASGAQAEWEIADWYLELDSRSQKDQTVLSCIILKKDDSGYNNVISCRFNSVESAVNLLNICIQFFSENSSI